MFKLHAADQERKRDDGLNVLLRFRGQAQNEIQFQVWNAAAEDHIRGAKDIFLRNSFIDHLPKPLRSGFGRDGNGLVPACRQAVKQCLAHRVRAERRDRQAPLDGGAELADVGIVRQRGADEPDLAALFISLCRLLFCFVDAEVSRRKIEIPGHAEPAVPAAAARDLHQTPVAELGVRRQDNRGRRLPVKIPRNAFFDQ